jgi:multidrug efflux pump subunit AcrA (membrane-fusion protein)
VLRNQQAVDAAETALANAELTAPIAGTVGTISLEKGASSSGGSITIVGEGTALVSIEVPLASRAQINQGMTATVTPAGSTQSLDGTVSNIAVLETSGTAGDNPTYTTTIAVEDPELALKSGAKAGVEIVTGTATGVVTVPASAVTPTGSGTGTVAVVDSTSADTAHTVTVSTGAVGDGRVEITEGIEEGQIVVLADRTASIDSLTTSSSNSNRRVTGFTVPR